MVKFPKRYQKRPFLQFHCRFLRIKTYNVRFLHIVFS
nr:MAG TPA: hypothetical protein [Caudoviricetes sp.]